MCRFCLRCDVVTVCVCASLWLPLLLLCSVVSLCGVVLSRESPSRRLRVRLCLCVVCAAVCGKRCDSVLIGFLSLGSVVWMRFDDDELMFSFGCVPCDFICNSIVGLELNRLRWWRFMIRYWNWFSLCCCLLVVVLQVLFIVWFEAMDLLQKLQILGDWDGDRRVTDWMRTRVMVCDLLRVNLDCSWDSWTFLGLN